MAQTKLSLNTEKYSDKRVTPLLWSRVQHPTYQKAMRAWGGAKSVQVVNRDRKRGHGEHGTGRERSG